MVRSHPVHSSGAGTLTSNQRYRLLPALLSAIAIALFMFPVAVSAAPPLHETFTSEGSFSFAGPCPTGVTLVETFTEEVRVTTFFDNEGNPVRAQTTINFVGVITNPETGESVEDASHHTVIEDLEEGTVTQVGLVFSATVPGVGVVFHDVGRVVFDAEGNVDFEAGPHDVLNTAGAHPVRANFCKALT